MAAESVCRMHHPAQYDRVTFLKTAAETDGELMLVEAELAPGGGTFWHYHSIFSERLTAITGDLGVQLGQERRLLRNGDSILLGQRTTHRCYNASDHPIRFYVEIRPAQARFEHALRIGYGLAAGGQMNGAGAPKNLLVRGVLMELSDTWLLGPARLLNPLLRLLASIGRRRGIDTALIARYAARSATQ